jgi:hypothetical protein
MDGPNAARRDGDMPTGAAYAATGAANWLRRWRAMNWHTCCAAGQIRSR